MKIAIGSDHRGYELKEEVIKYLKEKEIEVKDVGTYSAERAEYPNVASKVAKAVQAKECDQGILICGTGSGMCITANKYKGIRCANCYDEYTAKHARLHNNANVLAFGAENRTVNEAICMVRIWLATEFEGGRHAERVKLIEEIEAENMK